MSTVVAISLSKQTATLVTCRIPDLRDGEAEPFDVLHVTSVPLNGGSPQPETADGSEAGKAADAQAGAESTPQAEAVEAQLGPMLGAIEQIIGEEIESTVAMLSSGDVLYRRLILPFSDPKTVDKVAQLQIQDSIPFDVEDFVIDNQVLGEVPGGFEILASLAPAEVVKQSLAYTERLGLDPKVMTSKASALCGIAGLLRASGGWTASGRTGIVEFSQSRCAVALFENEQLVHLRELDLDAAHTQVTPALIAGIRSSLASYEKLRGHAVEKLYVLAPAEIAASCARALPLPVELVKVGDFVRNRTPEALNVEQISWSVGLFAAEQLNGTSLAPLVDFRRGPFQYRKGWQNFLLAVRTDGLFLVLPLVLCLLWMGTKFYYANRQLQQVEQQIAQAVKVAALGQPVTPRRELVTLEEKVVELEDQLRAVGSLSSLSPLDSLKELSETIGREIDIEIEGMNIGSARLFFRGSLPDNPALGRLEGALNKHGDKFCKVQVEPKGRAPGSTRVSFTADIELCE